MREFSKAILAAAAVAVISSVLSIAPASALSAPSKRGIADATTGASEIVKVHAKRHHHKHVSKYHRRHRIVEAPFTRVETGYGRRRGVLVDAPFAFVSVGRHGRYVRAPFVDLWIPR